MGLVSIVWWPLGRRLLTRVDCVSRRVLVCSTVGLDHAQHQRVLFVGGLRFVRVAGQRRRGRTSGGGGGGGRRRIGLAKCWAKRWRRTQICQTPIFYEYPNILHESGKNKRIVKTPTLHITDVLLAGLAAGHSVVADAGRRDADWLLAVMVQLQLLMLLLLLIVRVTVLIVAEMVIEREAAFVLRQHERRRRRDGFAGRMVDA